MKTTKLFLFGLALALATTGAFAKKTKKTIIAKRGYTIWYASAPYNDRAHYTWSTAVPPITSPCLNGPGPGCYAVVIDGYTPQPATPVPSQYLECPTCPIRDQQEHVVFP